MTGAASGIGREQAFLLAEKGAKLAVCDITFDQLNQTAKEICNKFNGVQIECYKCNLADKEDIYKMATLVEQRQGNVDVLINNAGIVSGTHFLETPDHKMEITMKVNALAHFWTVKAFLPKMLKKNSGHIVAVCSASAIFSTPRLVDYGTSKFAVRGFMDAFAI